MHLIFLGPPGSGKGTQSSLIVDKYNIPHISTGNMFRAAVSNQTEAGLEAHKYMEKGLLVPDAITIKIAAERLGEKDCEKGYLLDGFPRTIAQAEALDEIAKKQNRPIQKVINLVLDPATVYERVAGRRVCPKCGETYHLKNHPPKVDGICNRCGSELIQRKDDNPDLITTRLKAYEEQTAPLVDYYRKNGLLLEINALQDIKVIFEEIDKVLQELK